MKSDEESRAVTVCRFLLHAMDICYSSFAFQYMRDERFLFNVFADLSLRGGGVFLINMSRGRLCI